MSYRFDRAKIRPSNYGSRIDYILCSPGLRPWIKGGDILNKVFGSDHCPVYIDLHESIDHPILGKVNLRDMMNPPNRPPSTAPTYPNDVPREAPEPPRFATKFLDEFSGRQTTLKSFFGGKPAVKAESKGKEDKEVAKPKAVSTAGSNAEAGPSRPRVQEETAAPFSLARAAFATLDMPNTPPIPRRNRSSTSASIDMTGDDDDESIPIPTSRPPISHKSSKESTKPKPAKNGKAQPSISSFFAPPKRRSITPPRKEPSIPPTSQSSSSSRITCPSQFQPHPDEEQDAAIASAIIAADEERSSQRDAKKKEVAPIWNNLFAKKLPPMCSVHGKPCKDFIVKIPGPNKGKRFWLCSL